MKVDYTSLEKLTDTIEVPAETIKPHAPKMISCTFPNEYIGPFIGPGGKEIQNLQRETKHDHRDQ